MIVKFQLPSGLEIISLPTENFYGGHWDLGPTWNYVVLADRPFLVDTGKFGQGQKLIDMMAAAGIKASDLEFVLISHSHEDHDGGLAELVDSTQVRIKAHTIYNRLIRTYPRMAPEDEKRNFPAKCWHCLLPESFYTQNCLDYHGVLQNLQVDSIESNSCSLGTDIETRYLPGHSPDCLAVFLGHDAVIVGDIVLPDITPWPTCEKLYNDVAEVLQPEYMEPSVLFGLQSYLQSLGSLKQITQENPDILVLPAHRLYYNALWQHVKLADRIDELIEHHIQRAGAIIEIMNSGPKSAEEIARIYFDERLLKGFGSLMAVNEIVSHCELMIRSGDLVIQDDSQYMAAGSTHFEAYIHSISGGAHEHVA